MSTRPTSASPELQALGQRLEAARIASGRSARSVAEAAGISSVYLRVIERAHNPATGKPSRPTRGVLAALAEAVGEDLAVLHELAGYAPPSPHDPVGVAPPTPPPSDPAISDLAWHELSADEFAHLCFDVLVRLGFTAKVPQMRGDMAVIEAVRVAEISQEVQDWIVICRHGDGTTDARSVDDFLAFLDDTPGFYLFMTSMRLEPAEASRIIAEGEANDKAQVGYLDRPMIEDLCSPYTEIVTEYFSRTASSSLQRAARRSAYFEDAAKLWRSTRLLNERLERLRRNLAQHRKLAPDAFSPGDDVIYATQRNFVEYTADDDASFRTTIDFRLANIGSEPILRDRQTIFGVQPVAGREILNLALFSADAAGPPGEPLFALDTDRRKVIELGLPREVPPGGYYDYSMAFTWPCGGSLHGLRFQEVAILCFVGHLGITLRFPQGWAPEQTQLFERQRIRSDHLTFVRSLERERSYDVSAEIDDPIVGMTYKLSCMLRRRG